MILAVDVKISGEERFKGKPVIRVGTATVIKMPLVFIEKVEKALENKKLKRRRTMKEHASDQQLLKAMY